MARVNTSWTVACAPRRSKRSLSVAILDRDRTARPANARSTARLQCGTSKAFLPPGNVLRSRQPTPRGAASLILAIPDPRGADVARPGCPSWPGSPPVSRKTQYKCGKSRVENNHPLGKPEYNKGLLPAPALLLSLELKGRRNRPFDWRSHACSFRCRWIHEDAAIRAVERPLMEAFGTVGRKA